jgi:hypothetical protein
MRTIIINEGQNIIDVAVRFYGDATAVFQLLNDNPLLEMDSVLMAGMPLLIDESKVVNPEVVRYFTALGQIVNTGDEAEGKPEGIGYWYIELDNIVQ